MAHFGSGLGTGWKKLKRLIDSPAETERDELRSVVASEFDSAYYLATNPDVAAAGADPLNHFLNEGWKEGRRPHPDFDTLGYLISYPDVHHAGINPYYHYLVAGRSEGRHLGTVQTSNYSEWQRDMVATEFDSAYYLLCNPDVAEAGIEPIDHFMEHGWREGRSPNTEFQVDYYLHSNDDVRAAGMNPFLHYLLAGRAEGRAAQRPNSVKRELLASAVPPQISARNWKLSSLPKPLTSQELNNILSADYDLIGKKAALSISHDNYTISTGGIQSCIGDEQLAFNRSSWNYINLSPSQPLPLLSDCVSDKEFLFALVINGNNIGSVRAESVISTIVPHIARNDTKLIIHSMLGHSPEIMASIASHESIDDVTFWIHDFFSICTSYALLRNNIEFCNAPQVDSAACNICVYGEERRRHLQRLYKMLASVRPRIAAPSQAALDYWYSRAEVKDLALHVAPHAVIEFEPIKPTINRCRPLRVAFIGAPALHKGWATFVKLAQRHRKDTSFKFFHLGANQASTIGIEFVHVAVSAQDRDAMLNALRQNEIDVVVNWTLCFETFSFTTLEAIASGAFLIVQAASGNAAVLAASSNTALLVDSEEALYSFFSDPNAVNFIRTALEKDRKVGSIKTNGISGSFLLQRAA